MQLIAQRAAHLILGADGNAQIQAPVQDIDVFSEGSAVECVVRLEPDRLVLVLRPQNTERSGHE